MGMAIPAGGVPQTYQQPQQDQLAQQFGQMNLQQQQTGYPGPQAHQKPPMMAMPGAGSAQLPSMNQLHPSDVENAPFQVEELLFPPPPINLPENVGFDMMLALGGKLSLTMATD